MWKTCFLLFTVNTWPKDGQIYRPLIYLPIRQFGGLQSILFQSNFSNFIRQGTVPLVGMEVSEIIRTRTPHVGKAWFTFLKFMSWMTCMNFINCIIYMKLWLDRIEWLHYVKEMQKLYLASVAYSLAIWTHWEYGLTSGLKPAVNNRSVRKWLL